MAVARIPTDDDEALILEVVRDARRASASRRAPPRSTPAASFRGTCKRSSPRTICSASRSRPSTAGSAARFSTYVKVVEEVAKACASSALIIAVQELGALPILIGGNEEQKRRFIPKLATGEWIAAYALTEAGSGSDAAGSMRTPRGARRRRRTSSTGTKIWITQGGIADVVTVFAVTDPAQGPNGISAFVVEKGTPGFSVGKLEKKMGIRGSPTVELHLRKLPRPGGEPLGADGEGFKIAMKVLDKSRPGIAAQALGIATGALEYATNYLKERDRVRQAARAAARACSSCSPTCAPRSKPAGCCSTKAARKCDEGAADLTTWAAMAKLKCGDVAMSVTTDAVQLLGGFGYSTEYPVERMMRDAKITQIYEGTQQIQRIVIARLDGRPA